MWCASHTMWRLDIATVLEVTVAFLDYYEIVHPHIQWPKVTLHPVCTDWMDCFTKDSRVCSSLFSAGVPVWYIHLEFSIAPSTIIKKPITYIFSDDIICTEFSVLHTKPQPFATLFDSPGGKEHMPNLTRFMSISCYQLPWQMPHALLRWAKPQQLVNPRGRWGSRPWPWIGPALKNGQN